MRVEQCTDEYRKKTFECVNETITRDELNYSLKRKLRVPPEQLYQHEKEHYYFHDLYIEGGKECNPVYDGCTPNCRFYPEFGMITDEEVIEDHNKLIESLRRDNRIVNHLHKATYKD